MHGVSTNFTLSVHVRVHELASMCQYEISHSIFYLNFKSSGGNYFMIGGGLNGGRILGKYPDSFHKDAPHMLTRGRVIPSLSWESIMNGVAEWLDITGEDKLNALLPNRKRFRRDLFKKGDLFE